MQATDDPTKFFIVLKLLEGLKRSARKRDLRHPITAELLHKIVLSLPAICKTGYEAVLFSAAYTLAFAAFLRVGEITRPRKDSTAYVLDVSDVKLDNDAEISVWCVGSSIVKRAEYHAFLRPGGKQLGLHMLGIHLWWQGIGGFRLLNLRGRIRHLLTLEDPPKFIFLHCGANDIGSLSLGKLQHRFLKIIHDLQSTLLPSTSIIWSQMLPRAQWRCPEDKGRKPCENSRRRLNRLAAKTILEAGGYYIKHPELMHFNDDLYDSDGVHLTSLGNSIF
ncbi:hypothetical protein FSP39_001727 [Pinctada imbricata]|uniref:SGNH hydrolase-type esterase domain-containing protein n=1 Tax=Pinctada imbricata TaxID=66713 RepID=A0AA89C2A6_PINIB|nr:hypothetical protein FSP39_001727 [Pinctada imbricata]